MGLDKQVRLRTITGKPSFEQPLTCLAPGVPHPPKKQEAGFSLQSP